MHQMTALIENLLIFLIVIIIGYIFGAKKLVKPTFKDELSTFMFKITLPAMVVNAIVQPFNSKLIVDSLFTFGITLTALLISFLIGFLFMKIFRIEAKKQGIWLLASTFSNIGYMGYPVISAMYGSEGLFLASFANIAWNLVFYSFGIMMVARGSEKVQIDWRSILFNNIMISIYIGLILYFARIPLPGFVQGTLGMVGDMTTPLAMLIIGLKLGEYPLKEVFNNKSQYQIAFVRLVAAPLAIVALLKLFPLEGYELMLSVLVILNAMPIPANATIMATEFGGDVEFSAKSTTLSTLLCLVTIPLIFFLI